VRRALYQTELTARDTRLPVREAVVDPGLTLASLRLTEFERIVDETLEALPDWVVAKIDNLVVVVEEAPDPEYGDILGVYEGVSLAERADYSGAFPDRILIFRRPHLHLGLAPDELAAEIRRTVLHELAHHLGIDDTRLTELGWD
jgi:predicted Zn-dependent protease with MMP-like domain